MKKDAITLDSTKVLEWYDGIVRGIGIIHETSYLIVLAAWKIDEGKKLYLMLALDEDSERRIIAPFESGQPTEENWGAFTAVFENFIKNYSGSVYLVHGDLEAGKRYEWKVIDASVLSRVIPYDVLNTFQSANLSLWFG